MADDYLNVEVIRQMTAGMEQYSQRVGESVGKVSELNSAMRMAAESRQMLAEQSELFDASSMKDAENAVKMMEKKVGELGEKYKELLEIKKQELGVINASVAEMDRLARKQSSYAKQQSGVLGAGKEAAKQGDKAAKQKDKELAQSGKIEKAIKNQSKQLGGYMQSMSGVNMSLVGIIALIIDAYNQMRKIGAMSRQISAQWGGGNKELQTANGLIWEIRGGFKKSFEVAGQYVNSLSQAGLSMKETKNLASELMAIETMHGLAVAEQVGHVKDMMNNYGIADAEAQKYLRTIQLTNTEMRGPGGAVMSMSEMLNDVKELAQKTRVYNTDLLGTLALYNALARKDIAEKLGLGDAPLQVRKEIVATVAGFSSELEDGWKAALGEGATAAARILNFEKLLPADQFKQMAEFVTEKTQGMVGDTREIAIRQLLKQFGFTSKEVQKVMAEAFMSGGLSGEGLKEAMGAVGKSREAMENMEQKAVDQRDALIQEGKNTATALTSLQDLLKDWVQNNIITGIVVPLNRAVRKYMGEKATAGEKAADAAAAVEKGVKADKGTAKVLRDIQAMGQKGAVKEAFAQTEFGQHRIRTAKYEAAGSEGVLAGAKFPELEQSELHRFVQQARGAAPSKKEFENAMELIRSGSAKDAIDMMIMWVTSKYGVPKAIQKKTGGYYESTTSGKTKPYIRGA